MFPRDTAHLARREYAACLRPARDQGNPSGALRAALTPLRDEGRRLRNSHRKFAMRIASTCIASLFIVASFHSQPSFAQSSLPFHQTEELKNPSHDPDNIWSPDDLRTRGPGADVVIYKYELSTSRGTYLLSIIESRDCTLDACPGKLFFIPSSGPKQLLAEGLWDYGDAEPRLSDDLKDLLIGNAKIPLGK